MIGVIIKEPVSADILMKMEMNFFYLNGIFRSKIFVLGMRRDV